MLKKSTFLLLIITLIITIGMIGCSDDKKDNPVGPSSSDSSDNTTTPSKDIHDLIDGYYYGSCVFTCDPGTVPKYTTVITNGKISITKTSLRANCDTYIDLIYSDKVYGMKYSRDGVYGVADSSGNITIKESRVSEFVATGTLSLNIDTINGKDYLTYSGTINEYYLGDLSRQWKLMLLTDFE